MSENKLITLLTSTALAVAAAGCTGTTSTHTNANMAGTHTVANANTGPAPDASPVVSASEPYKYRATVSLTAQTLGGERATATPSLSADVARNGSFSYFSFDLSGGERVTYLDREQAKYVILPNRGQYAELPPDAAGFDLPPLMVPGQVIAYLQKRRGYERAGEEQLDGRAVVKYAAAGANQPSIQSADVSAETFIYVDKNTGLPLRTEILTEATDGGEGIKGIKIVSEMSDIQRNYDQSIFEVPQGMNQVAAEQVRQQVNAVVSAANAIAGALTDDVTGPSPATVPTSTAAR